MQVAVERFRAICGQFRLRCAGCLSCRALYGSTQKFTEPVALSSTFPVNLRLPPTALGSGFDLLALRARCKSESTGRDGSVQASATQICRILRPRNCPHFHDFSGGLGRTLWITGHAVWRAGDGTRARPARSLCNTALRRPTWLPANAGNRVADCSFVGASRRDSLQLGSLNRVALTRSRTPMGRKRCAHGA